MTGRIFSRLPTIPKRMSVELKRATSTDHLSPRGEVGTGDSSSLIIDEMRNHMSCRTRLRIDAEAFARPAVQALASALALLGSVAAAAAQDLQLTRTATSGVESHLAWERAWDRNTCQQQPVTVTITRPTANGTVSVREESSTIPVSTAAGGSTGNCAGKQVTGKHIMYRSKPGFQGTDSVSYEVTSADGRKRVTTITVNVAAPSR